MLKSIRFIKIFKILAIAFRNRFQLLFPSISIFFKTFCYNHIFPKKISKFSILSQHFKVNPSKIALNKISIRISAFSNLASWEKRRIHAWTYVQFRGFTKFGIKVAWSLQFLGYLRTLSLKFQKAGTKIGDFLPKFGFLGKKTYSRLDICTIVKVR